MSLAGELMVTIDIEEVAGMFRAFMKDAYINGYGDAVDRAPVRFDRWFEKNYGDIIALGTDAPASEKMSEKEEKSP